LITEENEFKEFSLKEENLSFWAGGKNFYEQ
jgi:hypothetical protein